MGQYFIAVKKPKKYVRPWDIGWLAKLFEWCANSTAGIFPYLLRKSNEGGGGDINMEDPQYVGRWASDEMYLVGDYDDGNLYDITQSNYHNISKGLVKEYNEFIRIPDLKLKTA